MSSFFCGSDQGFLFPAILCLFLDTLNLEMKYVSFQVCCVWNGRGCVAIQVGYGSVDMETIDLGSPQLLNRKDGKMVALYYWSTKDCLHHIAASIWDADN